MVNAYFRKFINQGVPFMESSEKGNINDLIGEVLHIVDFGFIRGRSGEYVVLAFREHPHTFYFGGLALTDFCRTVDADNKRDNLAAQGIVLSKRESKTSGNEYMTYEFTD